MNEKTRIQIEAMKKQTIGVEVEMNNISREKAATIAANFFGTERCSDTHSRNGYCTWSAWDGSGNSKGTSAFRDPMIKNAKWLHRF